jgi:hypothetical protein
MLNFFNFNFFLFWNIFCLVFDNPIENNMNYRSGAILLLISLLCFNFVSKAQHNVVISPVEGQNILMEHALPADSLKYFPYCTISIAVYNFDKLNKKEFRNQSSRLESFALNACIRGKTICPDQLDVPVFVVNYEKEKFTQITHQQGILINKMLINKDGKDLPNISIAPKTVERSKMAYYIGALKQVGVLLKNTASLNIVSGISNITDAFSEYIDKICEDQESDYEWSFPVIPATDITKPYKVNMFIIKPNGDCYSTQHFIIRNNEAWLESAEAPYKKYPYILVTTSFSGYFADEKLPSTLSIESLDKLTLDATRVKLYNSVTRLSKEQFDAEADLLSKYENYLKLKEVVSLIPVYASKDEIMTQALNAYFLYRQTNCTQSVFFDTDVYKKQLDKLDKYANEQASQISFFNSVRCFLDRYYDKCIQTPDAENLETLYKYHDMFAEKPFIRNSLLFYQLNSRMTEAEADLYLSTYSGTVTNLKTTLLANNLSDKEKLKQGEADYNTLYHSLSTSNCRPCRDSIYKVIALFEKLENNKLSAARTEDVENGTKYLDSLQACEALIDADLHEPVLNSAIKNELLAESTLLKNNITFISAEKNTFVNMPIIPKSEFRTEKDKFENELNNASKLIRQVKSKS